MSTNRDPLILLPPNMVLPQRQKMCSTCPSRLIFMGSVDEHLRREATHAHLCHNALGSICAGFLASTPDGIKQLSAQIYEEMDAR
jgi:hypothetical protein